MSKVSRIRVLIADDHAMVRTGLATFIRVHPDLELVGEARNGRDAVRLCEQVRPDVILMDLVMPQMDGVAATRVVHQRWPEVQVVALTSFKDQNLVQDALRAGAISYLLKDVSAEELAGAIRATHAGRPTLAPEAAQVLIDVARAASSDPEPGHDLTPREREVLELLVEGLSNPQIAAQLVISVTTVRSHVTHIFSKLGVSNRGEAIAATLRKGLLS